MSDPSDPEPHPDYAHTRDPQAQRTRTELWVILGIVAVVLVGAFVWRAATGRPPGPQVGWNRTEAGASAPVATPAAGAGVPPHGVGTPPPRPLAP